MRGPLIFLLTLIATAGCGGGDAEAEFGGRPLSEWVQQARGSDAKLRLSAYDALGSFQQNDTAIEVLEGVATKSGANPAERLGAVRNLYRATGDAERVLPHARAAIQSEADGGGGLPQSAKAVEELVFWLGTRARPLIPDLKAAQAKVRGRDATAAARRKQIEEMIQAIPAQ